MLDNCFDIFHEFITKVFSYFPDFLRYFFPAIFVVIFFSFLNLFRKCVCLLRTDFDDSSESYCSEDFFDFGSDADLGTYDIEVMNGYGYYDDSGYYHSYHSFDFD